MVTLRNILCVFTLLVLVGCSSSTQTPTPAPTPQSTLVRGAAGLPPAVTEAAQTPIPVSTATATTGPSPTPSPIPSPTVTLPPNERMVLAQEAERIGEWDMALSLYQSLSIEAGHGASALFRLGDLYLRDDREVEAALAWQEALNREPNGPLAPFLKYRLARGLAALGRHESAIGLWQEIDAAIDDVDDVLADHMADSYLALGDVDQAAAQWQRIYETESAPRVSRALAARQVGKWHADNQRSAEAMAWYAQTLELSQVHTFRAELLWEMARMAQALGDEPAARAQWHTLFQEYPDTPQGLSAAEALKSAGEAISSYQMGELYFKNKRWNEAARAFFTSLESEADLPAAHQQAALALEQSGNYAASFKEWRKIVETHAEAIDLQDDAWLGMGRAHVELGDMDVAIATLEQTVAQYPKGDAAPEALWLLGVARREQGANDVAAATFERLATTYPEAARVNEALWQAGMMRYRAGQAAAGQADFTLLATYEAEETNRALFWAGKAAQLAGNHQAAVEYWAKAAATDKADYYTLRAADLLNHTPWQPRAQEPFSNPARDDFAWLYKAADLPPSANLLALPEEPRIQRGKTLLLLGERGAAFETFREAIREQENPQALWAMANDFRAANLPSMSIVAATRLMELLEYNVRTVPPRLAMLAYPLPYESQLRTVATQGGFDPLIFAALIHQESTWEPRARSSAAARGLTQVIPDTGKWIAQRLNDPTYRYHHLDRPVVALRYGSYYLDYVLGVFNDNPFKALAAYNSGPGNARRWDAADDDLFVENIPLRETRYYIERLYEHWHGYQRAYRQTP